MPRKQLSSYASWNEIDAALKTLAEIKNIIIKAETEKNARVIEAKTIYAKIVKPLEEQEKIITKQIELFALNNRKEIDGQTLKLNFGKIAFRKTSRLSYPTAKVAEIIGRLRLKSYDSCIRLKEELDKEALEKLTDEQLEDIGIKRLREESLTVEPDMDALKNVR